MESKERQAYWVGVINEARSYRDGISAYLESTKSPNRCIIRGFGNSGIGTTAGAKT